MKVRNRASRWRLFHDGSMRSISASTSSEGSFSAATSSAARARSICASGRCSISSRCWRIRAGSDMGRLSEIRPAGVVRDAAGLRRALLAWYRRHRRAMPWRETRDPYRIWVSEIMLQQTQVATATPYYERFVTRFPDVRALARARPEHVLAAWAGRGYYRRAPHPPPAARHAGRALPRPRPEHVLAAWAGLGYYRRARHLHEAAGIVVREHAGRLPSDPRAFGALPGVGRYTLGAVLSMGFGSRLPVLDGNVARVLARLTARPLSVKRGADARVLWAMAEALLPGAAAR